MCGGAGHFHGSRTRGNPQVGGFALTFVFQALSLSNNGMGLVGMLTPIKGLEEMSDEIGQSSSERIGPTGKTGLGYRTG